MLGGPHQHANEAAYEHVLASLRKRRSLRGRVHVTGWAPDVEVRAWFDAADVCLAPYTDPGLVTSAAVVWALASGRPLIASRIPVFRELVHDWDCAEHGPTPPTPTPRCTPAADRSAPPSRPTA